MGSNAKETSFCMAAISRSSKAPTHGELRMFIHGGLDLIPYFGSGIHDIAG